MKVFLLMISVAVSLSPSSSWNPSNSADVFEGDIIPDKRMFVRSETEDEDLVVKPRLAIDNDQNLWPQGIIYYYNTFKQNPMLNVIREAIKDIESKTCLRFKEIQQENQVKNYVYIYSGAGKGCLSNVGMQRGKQLLSLEQPSCNTKNVAVHEILHSAGLWHMHSRPDRDNFINVYLQNVQPALRYAFDKHPGRYIPKSFDFNSIMLYFSNAFSSNGQDTMRKKDGSKLVEDWNKSGMSPGDVIEIKDLYKCNSGGIKNTSTKTVVNRNPVAVKNTHPNPVTHTNPTPVKNTNPTWSWHRSWTTSG